jgi:hypothetical protein
MVSTHQMDSRRDNPANHFRLSDANPTPAPQRPIETAPWRSERTLTDTVACSCDGASNNQSQDPVGGGRSEGGGAVGGGWLVGRYSEPTDWMTIDPS